MALLLTLALLAPPALYLMVVNVAFGVEVGFFSIVGTLGAFLVGAAAYRQLQAKIWQYEVHYVRALYLLGAALVGASACLVVYDIPADEAVLARMLVRLFGIGFLVICYILPVRHLDVGHKWEWIAFACVAATLVILTVLSGWVASVGHICFYLTLSVSLFVSVRNGWTIVRHNLLKYNQPFVLYRRAEAGGKPTDLFSDVLFILFPVLFALVR